MKKILCIIALAIFSTSSFGQYLWGIDFDSPAYLNRIYRDTISNPNCIWQIGQPNKIVFTSAYSAPNVIVTDTVNPVPASDTSVFYLEHVTSLISPHVFTLHFWYRMDGDSTDFGTVEVSPDTGNTWINVLTQDTTYNFSWGMPKPTLRGSTIGWQPFYLFLMDAYVAMGSFSLADTILFRFTYVTDSLNNPHDGWMIDNIRLEDWIEGVHEIHKDNFMAIYPNPASEEINIRKTINSGSTTLQILNYTGQVLYENSNFIGEMINTRQWQNGIYLLKYSSGNRFSIKKFIVQH